MAHDRCTILLLLLLASQCEKHKHQTCIVRNYIGKIISFRSYDLGEYNVLNEKTPHVSQQLRQSAVSSPVTHFIASVFVNIFLCATIHKIDVLIENLSMWTGKFSSSKIMIPSTKIVLHCDVVFIFFFIEFAFFDVVVYTVFFMSMS